MKFLTDAVLKKPAGKNVETATITLEVRESNSEAVNFYCRRGFVEISKRNNFYNNPRENALILKLVISASADESAGS